ncbi:hypothetical protein VB773_04000 [Haloarculaceae archaeon H-GB2-1]|nr:hypothetical protein [Haloarculaceae archaeon H-GB11]MEA5406822.1 hypothetical protein [Haloarculaceae archaeon H-GB2-1]
MFAASPSSAATICPDVNSMGPVVNAATTPATRTQRTTAMNVSRRLITVRYRPTTVSLDMLPPVM